MTYLKLVSSNSEPSKILYSDSLINSAFTYIAAYIGGGAQIEDIYASSISLLENLTCNGYPPSNFMYLPDLDLWEKRIDSRVSSIERVPVKLSGDVLKKLEELCSLLKTFPEDEVEHLDEQRALEYGSYVYFESFLNFLDGEKTPLNLPPIIRVLNGGNLDERIKFSLKNIARLKFTGGGVGFFE